MKFSYLVIVMMIITDLRVIPRYIYELAKSGLRLMDALK
jgi:hypothetical protein